jgi:hypothetical protein
MKPDGLFSTNDDAGLGVARAVSPDVRFGHLALRSLHAGHALAIHGFARQQGRLHGTGNPARYPSCLGDKTSVRNIR